MPHKAVERYEGPFEGNDDGKVAYVNVYVAMNDRPYTVAFDRLGREIGKKDGDIRQDPNLQAGANPSVDWVRRK